LPFHPFALPPQGGGKATLLAPPGTPCPPLGGQGLLPCPEGKAKGGGKGARGGKAKIRKIFPVELTSSILGITHQFSLAAKFILGTESPLVYYN